MARPKKIESTTTTTETTSMSNTNSEITTYPEQITKPSIHDIEWTDYVLSLLSDDEKISDNPTTDGLRRIFEIALDCTITESSSNVVQSPCPENEKRATVVHTISFVLNNEVYKDTVLNFRSVSGAADVYWGNCDKVYRNHPVAVAETRAEGRALRRGLRLRKVVAAEELAKDIDDHPDANSVNKISSNQINFIDVISKRLDINVNKMLISFGYTDKNVYNIEHSDAINIIKLLSSYQQDISAIAEEIKGYDANWK
jgi:hypothetical protein